MKTHTHLLTHTHPITKDMVVVVGVDHRSSSCVGVVEEWLVEHGVRNIFIKTVFFFFDCAKIMILVFAMASLFFPFFICLKWSV